MTAVIETQAYAAPGRAGSPVELKERYDNFIGGAWVPPTTGEYRANLTPSTGRAVLRGRLLRRPRTSSSRSTPRTRPRTPGRARSPAERAAVLNAVADAIEANLEMLAVAESYENGKPVRETLAADIPLAIDHFRYFAGAVRAEEGADLRDRRPDLRVPLPRAAGRRRADHPVQLPAADGGVEDRAGAGRRQLHGGQAGQPDAVVDPEALRGHRRHRPAGRAQRRQRPGRGDRQGAGLQQADRQGRVHRRDGHRPADHVLRRAEPDPVDDRAGRQVAEHLLRGRDGRRRRVPRQGDRGPRAVRVQQGRGLHLPVARADPGVDLRRVHGALPGADRARSGRATRSTRRR